jgi:hypothetical protein
MSSAIRYTELSDGKIAIVVSENGQVLFSSASKSIATSGFFEKSKERLPQASLSVQRGKDNKFILSAASDEQEADLSDWCNHRSCLCYEQVKGLGVTGKILTVLVPQTEEEDEEDGEDEGFELRFR